MLDYARQRMIKILESLDKVVLVTAGPVGIQTGEYPCAADGFDLYLLLPGTSNHLENLAEDQSVVLVGEKWELRGKGVIIPPGSCPSNLVLLLNGKLKWSRLLRIVPVYLHIRSASGWGTVETIELNLPEE